MTNWKAWVLAEFFSDNFRDVRFDIKYIIYIGKYVSVFG